MKQRNLQLPRYIAHRGAHTHAMENTLSAFQAAEAQGFLMFECDVQLTLDQVPIIFHDEKLDRLTTGHGEVAKTLWKEIQALHAGIPTLAELLNWFQSSKMLMNLELKYPTSYHSCEGEDLGLLTNAVGIALKVMSDRVQNRILLSSFNLDALCLMRKHLPHMTIGLLIDQTVLRTYTFNGIKEIFDEVAAYSIHCDKVLLDRAELREAFLNLCPRLLVYTVNDPQEADTLFMSGIIGIFSDRLNSDIVVNTNKMSDGACNHKHVPDGVRERDTLH
jgi:glycerophosphoryl diester phosphodiesterase